MFRRLLALGIVLLCLAVACVLLTAGHGASFYASVLALVASVLVVLVALVSPWLLTRVLGLPLKEYGFKIKPLSAAQPAQADDSVPRSPIPSLRGTTH
jgi:hypothetical protein